MKARKLRSCLNIRFQEMGVGDVSTRFLVVHLGPSALVHPNSASGLGNPIHTTDPSQAVNGQGASGNCHTPCHQPGIASSYLSAYYTFWQPQLVLLGSWDRAPGSMSLVLWETVCAPMYQLPFVATVFPGLWFWLPPLHPLY